MKFANANANKDPSVAVAGGEGVAEGEEVVSALTIDQTTERGIMAGAAEEAVRDITLLCVLARLRHVVGLLPVIALLAQAALPVALALALQFVHVRDLRICVVDHPHQEAPPLLHHVATGVAVVALHHIHHVAMNGFAGPEDATAAVHPYVADVSALQHAVVHLVEARTRSVADAV